MIKMDDREMLLRAQKEIKLPAQSNDKRKWFVECKNHGKWEIITFDSQEDAWSFYYSKLSQLKTALMKTGLVRQKGE